MQEQSGALGAVRRRWYLVPLGLLAVMLLCIVAARVVPAQYVVTARVLLVPSAPADEPLANPYLSLGGLEPATSVLARTVSSAEGARELRSRGATGEFLVGQDPLTAGPVLLVEVRDATSQAALATLDVVLRALPTTLQALQEQVGVPAAAMIKSAVISQDVRPSTERKSQTRALLVAAAAGGTATLLGICLLDGYLLRRRRERPAPEEPATHPVAGYEPVHLLPDKRKARRRGDSGPRSTSADAAL